jgi:hypothetical protein
MIGWYRKLAGDRQSRGERVVAAVAVGERPQAPPVVLHLGARAAMAALPARQGSRAIAPGLAVASTATGAELFA